LRARGLHIFPRALIIAIVYAKFRRQTEYFMGNLKIENSLKKLGTRKGRANIEDITDNFGTM